MRRSSCSFLMNTRTCSMRWRTFCISRMRCWSSFSTFKIEAIKSATFPGWSMFTILRRISSEKSGLFSEISFISLRSARVSALTSKVSSSSSSRYSTSATIGAFSESTLRILNLFIVEMKILTPPSGRLIFLTIRAAVPTACKSAADGDSTSFLVITTPIKPSEAAAVSTTFVSSSELIISGVKMPGKMGRPDKGIILSLFERVWSTVARLGSDILPL